MRHDNLRRHRRQVQLDPEHRAGGRLPLLRLGAAERAAEKREHGLGEA